MKLSYCNEVKDHLPLGVLSINPLPRSMQGCWLVTHQPRGLCG